MDTDSNAKKEEGIRSWYEKRTVKARRALFGATLVLAIIAVCFWIFASLETSQRLQTFNGAITIPAAGGIWIAAFMFIWLMPMRELSFRGQESLERMEGRLQGALEDKIGPAIDTWQRIGERFEKTVVPKLEEAVDKMSKVADMLEKKGGPAIETARRLETHIEGHLASGAIEEIREAAKTISEMQGPKDGKPPDLRRTLSFLEKEPANGPAPQGGRK
jgi:hypothetical protein